VPASDTGKAFGEAAKQAVAELDLVRVPGQADLMFCREQGYLSFEDLQVLLRQCRRAYQESAVVPNISPHARFDSTDLVPLHPRGSAVAFGSGLNAIQVRRVRKPPAENPSNKVDTPCFIA